MGYTLRILKDFMMSAIHLNTSYEKVTDFMDPEALQGKRDTLECDIIIGGLISFSPIVIYVV